MSCRDFSLKIAAENNQLYFCEAADRLVGAL